MKPLVKIFTLTITVLMIVSFVKAQDTSNVRSLVTQTLAVTVRGDYAYISVRDSNFVVIDISIPTTPVRVGISDSLGNAESIALSNDFAFVADGVAGLRIFRITESHSLAQVGHLDVFGYSYGYSYAHGLSIAGDFAYVAAWLGGLRIINISVPSTPELTSVFATPDRSRSVVIDDSNAYVADGNSGLQIINVSNPILPTSISYIQSPGTTMDVVVSGNFAYVAASVAGLRIIDIADPTTPILIGSFDTPGYAVNVVLSGNNAFVADATGGLRIIDVSNPSAPSLAGFYDPPSADALGIAVSGDYAYIADRSSGLRIININNPAMPIEVGFYPVDWPTGDDIPLAIELLAFTASSGNSRITLNWRTGSETDNARFEIARDGDVVAIKESQGNSASEQEYAWTDEEVVNGRIYRYTLLSVSTTGERAELQSVEAMPTAEATSLVTEYALHNAYPNPFNPTTTIGYDLVNAGQVTLTVYNLMGQHVATLVNGRMNAGRHSVAFDATGLPSGMYVYRLETNGYSAMRKMVLMK